MANPDDDRASAHLLVRDVLASSLTRATEPGMWIEGGWPTAASESVARVGNATVGLWEVTTGVVTDIETDEVMLVLAGSGSVSFATECIDIGPGVLFRLQPGEYAEWTITSPLKVLTVSATYGE